MMLIFPRYDQDGLFDYHEPDFWSEEPGLRPRMWLDDLGEQVLPFPFQWAKVENNRPEIIQNLPWNKLDRVGFNAMREEASRMFMPKKPGESPFSLGAIFSPPKSISMGALAGPRVELAIIGAHRIAVGVVIGMLVTMLVTRKNGENVPIEALIFRFTHPFSRANDPLLHDHVEFIPDQGSGPLHTYPWFFFQHTLRQIYHYCLASELAKKGFSIEITSAEGLRWELSGVDSDEVKLFSKRSEDVEKLAQEGCRESLPAALRWAALSSSKALPKSPGLSLGQARGTWEAECPRERCAVLPGQALEETDLVMPDLENLFRKSASAHLLTLQGRALALSLGQACDPWKAMRQVDESLLDFVGDGRLVVSKIRSSRAFLFPEGYRQERKILDLVARGIGNGKAISLASPDEAMESKLKTALDSCNRIRVISTNRDHALSDPALVKFDKWSAGEVAGEIANRGNKDCVVAVKEAARNGDFLATAQAISLFGGFTPPDPRQRVFTLRKGKGRSGTVTKVEIRSGSVPREPGLRWKELENRPEAQRAFAVVSADYPDKLRREMNVEITRRLVLSHPDDLTSALCKFDFVVPQEEAMPGMQVVVFKNHPNFQLGTRWRVQKVLADGALELAKTKAKITMTAARLKELAAHLFVVEKRDLRILPGMRLHVEASFSQLKPSKTSLTQGEVVTVARFGEDRSIVLTDGREIPPKFRAFSPAFLLRDFPCKWDVEPKVVLVAPPPDNISRRDYFLASRVPKLIVFAGNAEKFSNELGCEQQLYKAQQQAKTKLRFVSGEGEFVPSAKRWNKLLNLHQNSIGVKEIAASEAVVSGDEPVEAILPAPGRKKKTEDEPAPPAKSPEEAPNLPNLPPTKGNTRNPRKPNKKQTTPSHPNVDRIES